MSKILFIAVSLMFLFFGISAYIQGRPTPKNERVYSLVKEYSPYYIDKRFGGLSILSKNDKEFKEKPSNLEVFHRLEALEKEWASTHMSLDGSTVVIKGDNSNAVSKIPLDSPPEIEFVHSYYGI